MRMIADMTIFFLPPTFVSVFSNQLYGLTHIFPPLRSIVSLLYSYFKILIPLSQNIFNTNIFNFQAKDGERVVSKWIWLYCSLFGLLTVTVYIFWYIWSKKKREEIIKKLGKSSQEMDSEEIEMEPTKSAFSSSRAVDETCE